ncbi:MAG TPA: D-alanine--D-alanine ligase [Pseudomonadota bacterium]|nr:D-alanine--D-alanine ligase [Pseudomonadota bacterium]
MRICQLIASYEGSTCGFQDIDPYPDASVWLPAHSFTTCLLKKSEVTARIAELATQNFDVFVNLCDGEADEDIAGIEVVEQLERLRVPFTGADSRCYRLSNIRRMLKDACQVAGIETPAHVFLSADDDCVEQLAAKLRLPILVKPPSGYASKGIEPTSRADSYAALRAACERTRARFGGALLEEFIEGREFTVLGAEPPPGDTQPLVYTPFEVLFPPGETFKHFELKWLAYEQLGMRPVDDPVLDERLRSMVARYLSAIRIVGYARCDVRMDSTGRLFLLDANVMPGTFYPRHSFGCADLILAHHPDGHRRFLEHLIACAQHRP